MRAHLAFLFSTNFDELKYNNNNNIDTQEWQTSQKKKKMGRVAKRPKAAAKSDQKKDPSSKRREAAEEKSERDVTTGVANVVEKMDDEDDDDAASSKSRKAVHFKALDKGITKKKTATRRKKDAAGLSTFAKIKSKLSEANATATTKQKYEAIKTTFLKQIKATNDVSAQVADQANKAANNASSSNSNDLNFVRKDLSSTRLTNTLIKSLLASQATTAAATPVASNAGKITDKNAKLPPPPIDNLRKVSQLSKKTKAKLKKHVWQESELDTWILSFTYKTVIRKGLLCCCCWWYYTKESAR